MKDFPAHIPRRFSIGELSFFGFPGGLHADDQIARECNCTSSVPLGFARFRSNRALERGTSYYPSIAAEFVSSDNRSRQR
jgi:hypothetical protein